MERYLQEHPANDSPRTVPGLLRASAAVRDSFFHDFNQAAPDGPSVAQLREMFDDFHLKARETMPGWLASSSPLSLPDQDEQRSLRAFHTYLQTKSTSLEVFLRQPAQEQRQLMDRFVRDQSGNIFLPKDPGNAHTGLQTSMNRHFAEFRRRLDIARAHQVPRLNASAGRRQSQDSLALVNQWGIRDAPPPQDLGAHADQ